MKFFFSLLFFFFTYNSRTQTLDHSTRAKNAIEPVLENCPSFITQSQQVVLSIAPGWNSNKSKVVLFERSSSIDIWKKQEIETETYIGKNGLGWGIGLHPEETSKPFTKMEGDGRAPAGVFRLLESFGTQPKEELNLRTSYLRVHKNSKFVDDPKHSLYNTFIQDTEALPKDKTNWASAEDMDIPAYHIGLIVDHNHIKTPLTNHESAKPVPGRGSCIFMHLINPNRKFNEKGEYAGTAGCTVFSEEEAYSFVSSIDQNLRPLLVQLTEEDYQLYKKKWCLPEL